MMASSITWLCCACFWSFLRTGHGIAVSVVGRASCSLTACEVSEEIQDQLGMIREKLAQFVEYERDVQKLQFDVQVHLEEARMINPSWSPRTLPLKSEDKNNEGKESTTPDWSNDGHRMPRAHDSEAIEARFLSLEHKLEQLSSTVYDKLEEYSKKIDQMETALKTTQKWLKTSEDKIRNVNDSASAAIQQMQIKLKDTEMQMRLEIHESVVAATAAIANNATSGHAEELSKRHARPNLEASTPQPSVVGIPVPKSCYLNITDRRLVAKMNGHVMPNTLIPSGGIVNFECRQDHWEIRGTATRVCHDGTWATSQPACVTKPRDPNAGASVSTTLKRPDANPQTNSTVCKPGQSGNVQDPANCHGFYMCSPGHDPTWVSCSEGTFFSPVSKICDWGTPSDCTPA